jgi:aldehyde:ferredoxin oxidoreductase
VKHDDIPSRWYTPLGAGPHKGKTVNRRRLDEERKEYFEAVGWDDNGIPTSAELERLGLSDVNKKLEEIRKTI